MSKNVLQFITPGPLTERFGFSTRVFISWITLGLVLGLIFGIAGISSGTSTTTTPVGLLVTSLFYSPIILCVYGLIGLGLDSIRKRDSFYYGWYWWLFPIVTPFVIAFWLVLVFLAFVLAPAGFRLPKPSYRSPSSQRIDPEQIRDEIKDSTVEEILEQFGNQLEEIDNRNRLEPEEKKVVRKLRGLDRSKLRSQMKNAFSNDELETLFLVLLKLLSEELI